MNLLVLRFLTMNTEDERRDEEMRALQAALHNQQQADALDDVTIVVSSSALVDSTIVAPTSALNGKVRGGMVGNDSFSRQNGTVASNSKMQQQSLSTSQWRPCKHDSSSSERGRQSFGFCCLPFPCTSAAATAVINELQPPSPLWQGRHRYQVTRPPTTSITRLLPAPQTPEDWPSALVEDCCPIHHSSSTADKQRITRCTVLDFSGSKTSGWKSGVNSVEPTKTSQTFARKRRLSL
jgi:hypothetical protein